MICDLAIKKWRAIQKGDLESTIGILRHFTNKNWIQATSTGPNHLELCLRQQTWGLSNQTWDLTSQNGDLQSIQRFNTNQNNGSVLYDLRNESMETGLSNPPG